MKDFLLQNYSLLTRIFEIIPALVGIILFKYYRNTPVKYFIYFLIYVVVIELLGSYPRYFANYEFLSKLKNFIEGTIFERNRLWFIIFWSIGSASFFSFYYQKNLKNKTLIRILKYVTLIFLVSSILYIIIYWNIFYNNSSIFIRLFSTSVISLCVVLYFLEILRSDTILKFSKSINFYISFSLLVWLLITTPLTFYGIYYTESDWSFTILRWQIYLFSNFFLYGMFTFALIWCRKKQNN